MWFIISGDWLFQWKCFISNKISSSANPSPELKGKINYSKNKDIGILPPGPILNQELIEFNKDNKERVVKQGL